MEVIRIAGYTEPEKIQIARRFLVPKQMKANGLTPENIQFSDDAIRKIIQYYTREAGVRNLEREIASLCRKVAKKVVKEGKTGFRGDHAAGASEVSWEFQIPVRKGRGAGPDRIGQWAGLDGSGRRAPDHEVTVMPGKGT